MRSVALGLSLLLLGACAPLPTAPPKPPEPAPLVEEFDVGNGEVETLHMRLPPEGKRKALKLTIVRTNSSPEWIATAAVCVVHASKEEKSCIKFVAVEDNTILPITQDTHTSPVTVLRVPSSRFRVGLPISLSVGVEPRRFVVFVDGAPVLSTGTTFEIALLSISCSSAVCHFSEDESSSPSVSARLEAVGSYKHTGGQEIAASSLVGMKRAVGGNWHFVSDSTTVKASLGERFGVQYRLSGLPYGTPMPLRRITRFPAGGLKNPASGKVAAYDEHEITCSVGYACLAGIELQEPWELVEGTWQIEVWVGSTPVISQQFQVTK